MYVCMYVCMYMTKKMYVLYMCVCMRRCACVCVCVCAHIRTHRSERTHSQTSVCADILLFMGSRQKMIPSYHNTDKHNFRHIPYNLGFRQLLLCCTHHTHTTHTYTHTVTYTHKHAMTLFIFSNVLSDAVVHVCLI